MKKIHYVYVIINSKNNKEYIGVRSHPNPKTDSYMGSSKLLNNLYKLEGIDNFKKKILQTFTSRKLAEDYESSLLTEEFCNSPNTYNIHNTGKFTESKHGFRKDLWYDYYNDIRTRYSKGENTVELGKFYGCDNGTIASIITDIKRTNSESQQIRFNRDVSSGARNLEFDKFIPEIIRLYVDKKQSAISIANHFKCDGSVIKRRLEEQNIPLRTHSESQKNRNSDTRWRKEVWNSQKEIVDLYIEKGNMSAISKIYKVDIGTIKNILNTNGIINTSKKKKNKL